MTLSSYLDYQHHSHDSILNGHKLAVGALQSPITLLPVDILTLSIYRSLLSDFILPSLLHIYKNY
jgi:hypothetical protein